MTNKKNDAVFTKPATTKLMNIHKESSNWYFIETLREIAERYCNDSDVPVTNVLMGYISDVNEHRRRITIGEFIKDLESYTEPWVALIDVVVEKQNPGIFRR